MSTSIDISTRMVKYSSLMGRSCDFSFGTPPVISWWQISSFVIKLGCKVRYFPLVLKYILLSTCWASGIDLDLHFFYSNGQLCTLKAACVASLLQYPNSSSSNFEQSSLSQQKPRPISPLSRQKVSPLPRQSLKHSLEDFIRSWFSTLKSGLY